MLHVSGVTASPQLSIMVRDPVSGQQRHLESMRTGDVTLPAAFPPLERHATVMRSFGLRDVGLERFCTSSIDFGHMVRAGGTPFQCHVAGLRAGRGCLIGRVVNSQKRN